jgi:hypothetical protein
LLLQRQDVALEGGQDLGEVLNQLLSSG